MGKRARIAKKNRPEKELKELVGGIDQQLKQAPKAKVEKNKYGFVKGTRKDRYCQLIEQGIWGKDQILAKVKQEFGTASPNAFSFFLRDCRLKELKVQRRVILMFGANKAKLAKLASKQS